MLGEYTYTMAPPWKYLMLTQPNKQTMVEEIVLGVRETQV